ncbi:outer membrane beta-barrel protein [Hymenobacter persicinus]|uniref:outer membrane beta-barrel protein n=1 Tax=Hymenobacter persicinus TaxID=2025506 RepID=UPI0013EA4796|nr:outer membrane beta-barrel protein [Hymenobacter persicinus]
MKKTTLTTALLVTLTVAGQAQDQPHKLEVGLDVLTYTPFQTGYNNFANTRNNDRAHWLSGGFVRYHFGQLGLRAGANYTTSTETVDDSNCADCLTGSSKSKELRLKVGGQYAPLATLPWLYGFADVYYRRYTSGGHFTGGFTGQQNATIGVTSNGVGLNAGVGATLKLTNHFSLNPEVYYDWLRARNSEDYSDPTLRSYSRSNSRTSIHTPAARLNLVYAF